jgi:REP element-mobilizing transposase RayT
MRKSEDFSGLRILNYAILSNHFHILVEVPPPAPVPEAEVGRRVRVLYGERQAKEILDRWEQWRAAGQGRLAEEELGRFRARMNDVSQFVKTLKLRYTLSYNTRYERDGTLWEGRFKSVLVEGSETALSAVAAYIDLNPVRAAIVQDPKDYRWSGYGEASGGGKLARAGLAAVYGKDGFPWAAIAERHRVLLYEKGRERRDALSGEIRKTGFSAEQVAEALAGNGKLPLPEVLRCRVRYFTDGLAIGGRGFVDGVFNAHRGHFGALRKDGARKMRLAEWGGLCAARDLRRSPVSVPLSE